MTIGPVSDGDISFRTQYDRTPHPNRKTSRHEDGRTSEEKAPGVPLCRFSIAMVTYTATPLVYVRAALFPPQLLGEVMSGNPATSSTRTVTTMAMTFFISLLTNGITGLYTADNGKCTY